MPLLSKQVLKKIDRLSIVPRFIIFSLDVLIVMAAFLFTVLLSHDFELHNIVWSTYQFPLLVSVVGFIGAFLFFKTYAGIVRYTSLNDMLRISKASSLAILMVWVGLRFLPVTPSAFLHIAFWILYLLFSLLALIVYRSIIKYLFAQYHQQAKTSKTVVVFGAGEVGLITKQVLESAHRGMEVIAFIDEDKNKVHKLLNGIKIYAASDIAQLYQEQGFDQLIISIVDFNYKSHLAIVDFCQQQGISILHVPKLQDWRDGSFSSKQLKSISIDDLLNRPVIQIENPAISEQIKGARILVTGAAGSIGSEIVRQVLSYEPALLVLVDIAETPMHALMLELQANFPKANIQYELVDIRQRDRLALVFQQYQPQRIYHAAAYKHVPMMELSPLEAVSNNVLGTKQVVDLALAHQVAHFLFVSTDKAVNPTSIMGASKRIAELYVQLQAEKSTGTNFVTTRFGNVLGSNGSVINLFKEQIQKGGPLTVTHPEVIRYFMTIKEACSLVIESSIMGSNGSIMVFDMGEPIKIKDLAERMIYLAGLKLNEDIEITYTGLRNGEKLYEELLAKEEEVSKTYHDKIFIFNRKEAGLELELCKLLQVQEAEAIKAEIKALVPEFMEMN
jgi:FlaA1/EpsC-like NDP-sugar epimerase